MKISKNCVFLSFTFKITCDTIDLWRFKYGIFLDAPVLSRGFTYDGDFGLLSVGYQDFTRHYNPERSFRIQKAYTWHFVLTGNGILETGGKRYNIGAGQVFFLPPDTQIRYFPDETQPWSYVWLTLSGDLSKRYAQLLGFESPVRENPDFAKSNYIIKNMFDELLQGGGYFGVLSSFYQLMELSISGRPATGIEGVKRLIDEGFTRNDFTIEGLCADAGISHPHLIRLFKEKYGITLIKYLNKKRIEYACNLLVTTELSVKSVAYSCGFSDELHFMKTFKKQMGVSALKYRNSHKI